jgi:hypothetical protein
MQEFGEALQDVQRQQDWPATPLEVIDSTEGATPLGESMTPSPGTLIRSALRPESDAVSVANAVEPEKRERRMFLRWFAVAFAALAIAIVLLVIMQGRQHNSEQKQPPAPLPASYEPLDVRITNDTGPTVSLKWTDPNGGAVTYVVDTTLHDVSIGPVQRATAVDSTTIASLDVRERYCFSVGAVYAFGQSPAYADPVCRAE